MQTPASGCDSDHICGDDLPALTRCAQAGCFNHGITEIVRFLHRDLAGAEPDPKTDGAINRPIVLPDALLHADRTSEGTGRGRKRHHDAVPDILDLSPTCFGHGLAKYGKVTAADRVGFIRRNAGRQFGRAHDVGEKHRNSFDGCVDVRCAGSGGSRRDPSGYELSLVAGNRASGEPPPRDWVRPAFGPTQSNSDFCNKIDCSRATKFSGWFDAELFSEVMPQSLVSVQGIRLSAASIERDHQLGPATLPQGLLDHGRLEVCDQISMFTESKSQFAEVLHRDAPRILRDAAPRPGPRAHRKRQPVRGPARGPDLARRGDAPARRLPPVDSCALKRSALRTDRRQRRRG